MFNQDIEKLVEGEEVVRENETRLYNKIREEFKNWVCILAANTQKEQFKLPQGRYPECLEEACAQSRCPDDPGGQPHMKALQPLLSSHLPAGHVKNIIHEEVEKYEKQYRGRELLGFVNYRTFETVVHQYIQQLVEPALSMLRKAVEIVQQAFINIAKKHFSEFLNLNQTAQALDPLVPELLPSPAGTQEALCCQPDCSRPQELWRPPRAFVSFMPPLDTHSLAVAPGSGLAPSKIEDIKMKHAEKAESMVRLQFRMEQMVFCQDQIYSVVLKKVREEIFNPMGKPLQNMKGDSHLSSDGSSVSSITEIGVHLNAYFLETSKRLANQIPFIIQYFMLRENGDWLQKAMMQILQEKDRYSWLLQEQSETATRRRILKERIYRLAQARHTLCKFSSEGIH
ncbi:Interferon-induced GTP-binding protein Mx2 [Saguinus oedipus]|uniref:Interferon-induced GTP-binding protein Mx2 n=1 Tax=Saguinus oedipus TaxID=9490 RepID=A0ABQ9TZN3_SAGOE|nr:Interferon-induced GTP-binding protein Mx2 [Saguinus oedipus]